MRLILLLLTIAISCVSCSTYNKHRKVLVNEYTHYVTDMRENALKIKVHSKDTICDIGGGFGFSSAMLANYFPGNVFYEEDIDRKHCNKYRFKRTFKLLNPQANIDNYRFFYGTDSTVPFRDKFFKAVTVFISIHEFKYRDKMMAEINCIMKDDGHLYIKETVYKNTPATDSTCKFQYLSETELYDLVKRNGFGITPDSTIGKYDSSYNVVGRFLECYKIH